MNKRRKNPDVVRVYSLGHNGILGPGWGWRRSRGADIVSDSGGFYTTKRQCLRLARELNPGCIFDIEEGK